VADAGSFRNQIKGANRGGGSGSHAQGVCREDVRLATFAVVAFLDESILNSNNPLFTDWPRMPLQEELFGVHTAGEMFFHCIDRLMPGTIPANRRILLEIYALCMLLGFRGRYSISGQEGVRSIVYTVTEKLQASSRRIAPAGSQLGAPGRMRASEKPLIPSFKVFSSEPWEHS